MEDCDLLSLETGTTEDAVEILKKFIEKHNQTFTFHELNQNGRRQKLWSCLFDRLENPAEVPCYKNCLTCIRILSRDKTDLNELVCGSWLETLLRHAGLVSQEEALSKINESPVDYEVMLEAQKCLCNIIFNSPCAQALSSKNHSIEGVVMRLRTYRDPELPHEIKVFDMKMLFLITALCAEVRPKLKNELHGLTYLMETLDLILKEAGGEDHGDERGATSSDIQITLSDDQVTLACEVLKVLFNLTVKSGDQTSVDEEEEAHFLRLVSILHDLLLCECQSCEKQDELHNHTVNLLMSIPSNCYEELMTPVQRSPHDPPKEFEYDGRNMEAVAVLLDFLNYKLNLAEQKKRSQHELLCPILSVLVECARHHRALRKFMRQRVLPPLTEVHTRPEEGSTLRNKLCRLLTTPVTQVCDLAANFLFILCKENVMRMVKYTGYGNAAGLLAKRGLMLGGSGNSGSSSGAHYSSDSEDSDTEEYKKFKPQINIMTGCYEKPHPDPMAPMTEEQKEYEAVRLVQMIDQLAKDGIVQPCRIGEDGRPEPVGQALELIEDLSRQQQVKPTQDDD
ncbi:synembryn-A [Periplaneta americana]|uniref:synembryn-A n=1 Tax=Periplaneta americana TaxID=6978 RepID=UPI0037E785F8